MGSELLWSNKQHTVNEQAAVLARPLAYFELDNKEIIYIYIIIYIYLYKNCKKKNLTDRSYLSVDMKSETEFFLASVWWLRMSTYVAVRMSLIMTRCFAA